jgi:Ni/Fe-hydrogenase subunit HybB-like protein
VLFASWALNRDAEMHVLSKLSRYVPVFLGAYLAVRVGDVIVRGAYEHLLDFTPQSASFVAEVFLGVVLPLEMFCFRTVRNSRKLLGAACALVILGVILNRLNVFVIGYHPPFAEKSYFPSFTEFSVSAGLVAALMLAYRIAVTYLPILEPRLRVPRPITALVPQPKAVPA